VRSLSLKGRWSFNRISSEIIHDISTTSSSTLQNSYPTGKILTLIGAGLTLLGEELVDAKEESDCRRSRDSLCLVVGNRGTVLGECGTSRLGDEILGDCVASCALWSLVVGASRSRTAIEAPGDAVFVDVAGEYCVEASI